MARGAKGDPGQEPVDWVSRAADQALRHAEQANGGTLPDLVTCASGISPSGRPSPNQLAETTTMSCRIRNSRATISMTEIWPPCEFRRTSFLIPAAATEAPISHQAAVSVAAERLSVPA